MTAPTALDLAYIAIHLAAVTVALAAGWLAIEPGKREQARAVRAVRPVYATVFAVAIIIVVGMTFMPPVILSL